MKKRSDGYEDWIQSVTVDEVLRSRLRKAINSRKKPPSRSQLSKILHLAVNRLRTDTLKDLRRSFNEPFTS
ncbi:MAG: hypothetical protein RJA61_53 [Candidatus Parcubacteria bacterium]|jgi:hypothetical protein